MLQTSVLSLVVIDNVILICHGLMWSEWWCCETSSFHAKLGIVAPNVGYHIYSLKIQHICLAQSIVVFLEFKYAPNDLNVWFFRLKILKGRKMTSVQTSMSSSYIKPTRFERLLVFLSQMCITMTYSMLEYVADQSAFSVLVSC